MAQIFHRNIALVVNMSATSKPARSGLRAHRKSRLVVVNGQPVLRENNYDMGGTDMAPKLSIAAEILHRLRSLKIKPVQSAYSIFSAERSKQATSGEKRKFGTFQKSLGKEWKQLSTKERAKFQRRAELDARRHEEEVEQREVDIEEAEAEFHREQAALARSS